MTGRVLPVLVRHAWLVLIIHRRHRCASCRSNGWCPDVQMARNRIRAWRRFGS